MADIFDTLATPGQQTTTPPTAAPAGDIFDHIAAQQTPPQSVQAKPDIFDQIAATPKLDIFDSISPGHTPPRPTFLQPPSGPTTMSAGPSPSVWARIKSVFEAGVPYAQADQGKLGRETAPPMQVVTPEAAMTPVEQAKHPVLTGAGQVVGSLTSPQNAAIIAGTGGLGELPGAAGVVIPRLISAGFGVQSIVAAYNKSKEAREAFARGDTSEGQRLLTQAIITGGVAVVAGTHAAFGGRGAAVDTEGQPAARPAPGFMEGRIAKMDAADAKASRAVPGLSEVVPHSPDSPVAEVLTQPAPNVQVTDSTATAQHIENQQTVAPPTATAHGTSAEAPSETVPTARVVTDSYIPVASRTAALAETVQRIIDNSGELQRLGLDPARIQEPADVQKMLEDVTPYIKTGLDPRVGSVIGFDAQKQGALETGMTESDLFGRMSGEAFSAEKAIAARSLLNLSQNRVLDFAKAVTDGAEDARTKFTTALAQHQAVLDQVKGVAAEAGRALGSFRIKESELPHLKIADVFSKLPDESIDKAAQLLSKIDPNDTRQVNDFIQQIKPSSTPEKIFEAYRNGLLSGPQTLVVKSASEIGMVALETMKKVVAGGLSKMSSSPERFASESYYYAKGAVQALRHAKAVISGEFNLEDAPEFEGNQPQAIKGTLGKVVRFPSQLLSRQTNLMYTVNYFGELNAQAARQAITEGLSGQELHARQEYLAHNPTDTMKDAANQTALYNTFQNKLGTVGGGLQQLIRSDPTGLSKYLFPFVKTPINLVKASASFSPYGILKGLATGDVDTAARGIVGSSILSGLAYQVLNGNVTGGGPIDFKKRETLEATGWQPYSVKIGKNYYSYHRFEPIGLALGLVADTILGSKLGDSEEVTQSKADNALAHVTRNMDDLPFFMGLSSIMQALEDPAGTRMESWYSRQTASLVPAGMADIAKGTDTTVRKPVGVIQTLESRIPGMTQNVPPVLDINGRPVQRPASNLGGANPFEASEQKTDPVVAELARLGISTPQPLKSVKVHGKPVQLTQDESTKLAAIEGQQFARQMTKITQQRAWQRRTDDQKREIITGVRKQISEQRVNRVRAMQDERLSSTEGLGKKDAINSSLGFLLDTYPLASPQAQETLQPVIFSKIVDFRKRARNGDVDEDEARETKNKIDDYNRAIRAFAGSVEGRLS
jgi:hypothetical protein